MILQLVIASERQDPSGAKGLPFKGAPSTLVQLLSDSSISVVLKQLIDEHKELRWMAPPTAHRHGDRLGGSPFEAHLSRNHLLVWQQGHIFQQQTPHPFAIPI